MEERNLAHLLILDFQPPELEKIHFLLLKRPSLGNFVMAARANEYSQGKISGLRVAPLIVREFEMDVHTLPYLKWITNKDLM